MCHLRRIKVAIILLTTFKDNSAIDSMYGHAHFLNAFRSIPTQSVHIPVSFSGYNFIYINNQNNMRISIIRYEIIGDHHIPWSDEHLNGDPKVCTEAPILRSSASKLIKLFVGSVHEDLACCVGIIDRVCWNQHGVVQETVGRMLWSADGVLPQLLRTINVHNETLAS